MPFDLHWPPHHWPDGGAGVGGVHFAQNHWPNADDGVPPTGPGGAGVFELALEDTATVTYAWSTAVEKHYDGGERRASLVDDPAVRYEGSALLLGPDAQARGAQVRAARTRLARFAALGSSFLLGLPFEALSIRIDSTALTVAVFSGLLAQADWAVPGVRVIVSHEAYGSTQAVIQTVTSDTIVVATDDGADLGNVGKLGAVIMPAAAIFLDAQQVFDRYEPSEPIERWQIRARNADAGFMEAGAAAELALDSVFTGLTIYARSPGTDGNAITVSYFGGGSDPAGTLVETTNHVEYQYQTGVTTIADFIAAFQSSTIVRIDGSVADDTDTISGEILDTEPLAGGTDPSAIEVGLGATVATYRSSPVWDRKLVVNGTIGDSINSMVTPQDMGGLPFTAQTAKVPDWGRAITMDTMLGDEWQWAKRILWTLKGRFLSFWLPTWRADLRPVSVGTGTLTVTDGDAAGDVRTWYPLHRRDLQCRAADGTVTYVRIASATNNGDGTTTLALVDEGDVAVSLGAVPQTVSWLELCHLESDEVPVTFQGRQFKFSIQARVVQE